MVTEWIKHKSTLVRAYFGDGRMAPVDSPMHKDFLTFLAKFQQKVMKAKPSTEKESYNLDVACNEYGVPLGQYNKVHASRILLAEKGVADKFLLRDVPEIAVQQFEYIISTFLSFLNKRKFKKLKALRTSQASLPIAASKDEILRTLEENQVMILAGDTGCGKSTQLPQYLLTAGYTKIACTQPRRIACVALSRRVAYETLNEYGSEVAYQTRFEKTKTGRTKLLFLTDGLLLRQMAADNNLPQYTVIILDEVHERHVSGDLLVSLLRDLTYRRQDLKLILMSATINLELFTSYFPGAPVVEVPGRLYPIELHYMAVKEYDVDEKKKSVKIDAEPYLKILQIIDKKYPNTERGDALIFLNGIAEINTVAEALKEYAEFSKRWIVLILHSTLSVEEQNKVFDISPTGLRKCILSTNIAETSVTIDEIRFVIDSGKVNLVRYDAVTRMQHLTQCWISKASAEQRKGRAGRTGPGVCYRMYSSEQLEKMEAFTLPEIKRISLESLVLQLLNMKLQIDVRDFPFLERPDKEALTEALESLKSQGVIDAHDERQLTPLGLILADLPVDVLIGKFPCLHYFV
ncbi:SMGL-2 protein [Aphelenchoides avenae]|nr:SMGL-2 protein [Aphelenchus avenae]